MTNLKVQDRLEHLIRRDTALTCLGKPAATGGVPGYTGNAAAVAVTSSLLRDRYGMTSVATPVLG